MQKLRSFRRFRGPLAFVSLIALASYTGCGGDDSSEFNNGDAGTTDDGSSDVGSFTETGSCVSSTDCNGGVCITSSGTCCASAANVCGSQCCSGGSVCLLDQCVMPGKPCHSANDCAMGEYCEPALGSKSDAGAPPDAGPDGAVCTQAPPSEGRCLPLPPTCAADAGADSGCIPACEYHPPAGGPLSAIAKWTWGPTANEFPAFTDVWSTPTVGRVYDTNCDGTVDELDSPVIIFVSGNAVDGTGLGTCCQCNGTTPTSCHTGVLRMLDGTTGREIWSLRKASANSTGFSGLSVAIGDVDGDKRVDIVAATGEGYVVLIDANGNVKRTSDQPIPGSAGASFGWGGGIAIADMDLDGSPEISYGAAVYTTTGGTITRKFVGANGTGGGAGEELSTLVDLDGIAGDHLELLSGNTAYKFDGTQLWYRNDLPDGFPGVGDFDKDGSPEAVLVANGKVWILNGATGATALGPVTLPGTGSGGPPTVADFDGDGKPEIGVAMATFYSVVKPNYAMNRIDVLWQTANHDLSSSVTGSTVFDFEGDGRAEVIYGDECFLWVFDGATGAVRFAASHSSFTATEASLLADVDGDGHAEMVMISNGADPSVNGWKCMGAGGTPTVVNGKTWVPGPTASKGYRGIVVFGDSASSWVGTRTLWSEHTYHVNNICDDRDTACIPPNVYGSIPKGEKRNWSLPWLNDFRQNVQDKGIFNAPDAVIALSLACSTPVVAHVSVRNIGLSSLPAGVDFAVFMKGMPDVQVGTGATTVPLFPGQTQTIDVTLTAAATTAASYYAEIVLDPMNPKFHECRTDNDKSDTTQPICVK